MYKFITLLALIFIQASYAKDIKINKGTDKEAIVTLGKDSVDITYKGEKISAEHFSLTNEDLELDPLRLEDINSDGFVDVSVLSGVGYGGVNICYDFYLAKDNYSKNNNLDLCNYKKVSKNKILSEAKDGARYIHDIYKITKKNDIKLIFSYENYEEDFCYLHNNKDDDTSKIVSCEALEKQLKVKDVYKKVVKKSYLYNEDGTKTKMYLIKGDVVKLIKYDIGDEFILVEFKGKKIIKKYIKIDNLK